MELDELLHAVGEISVRMRTYNALRDVGSEPPLRDREIQILELLGQYKELTPSELHQFFPHVKETTVSADLARLLKDEHLLEVRADALDMRKHVVRLSSEGEARLAEIKEKRVRAIGILAPALARDKKRMEILKEVVTDALAVLDKRIAEEKAKAS